MRVTNDHAAVSEIAAFRRAVLHLLRRDLASGPVLNNWQAVFDYLHVEMAHDQIELCRVLFLNSRNTLIRNELISTGTVDECAVYVREVIRRALELGAAALLLVHNHPSGNHTPSQADIDITRRLAIAGQRLGIVVHDHLVISASGHSSLREMGLI